MKKEKYLGIKIETEYYALLVERSNKNDTSVSHEVRQIVKKEFEKSLAE